MQDFLIPILAILVEDVLPPVIALLATFLAGQAVVLFVKLMGLIGAKVEEKHMVTLHKGIETGVKFVLDRIVAGALSEQDGLNTAIDIARQNNPATFRKLRGANEAAPAIAKGILNEKRLLASAKN